MNDGQGLVIIDPQSPCRLVQFSEKCQKKVDSNDLRREKRKFIRWSMRREEKGYFFLDAVGLVGRLSSTALESSVILISFNCRTCSNRRILA